jgi:SAM-dependent methyltransferase
MNGPRTQSPADADTDDVESFVMRHLHPRPACILEIGAGDGRLAARLVARGFSMKAVDLDEEAVASSVAPGVDAARMDYFDVRGQFDALLFTRSFHHIWPLDAAIAHAATLVAPGGTIIFDELAHDACDLGTAAWFYDVQALLEERAYSPHSGADITTTITPKTTVRRRRRSIAGANGICMSHRFTAVTR